MELDYKAIGKRIKIARIQVDLTQEKLAEYVNLSPSHMSNIETGTTKVSLTTIVNIANALSVSVDDLLCDNVIHAKPQFENDIKLLLDDCDDYEIRIVKDLLSTIIYTLSVAFREKPKSFSHKLQKSTTFCKLAKNKRAFERYFISYQTPFYLFIIMAHPVCIPVYLKYHNSMPYKFGQDDSG